ncbi:MAG: hypothetical protein FWH27_12225, partial [Planctomycetaceae bacterium]|nr:hypothetical protein [Planctomycetaceae bacterium]
MGNGTGGQYPNCFYHKSLAKTICDYSFSASASDRPLVILRRWSYTYENLILVCDFSIFESTH